MAKRGMLGLTVALTFALGACDHPTGPADEIAGEYQLAARVENDVEKPVAPSDDGAVLLLRPDRTWLLTRHRSGARVPGEGFGLTDRYSFQPGASEWALTMFSEGPFLQLLAGSARVHGDTLRWGGEVFVRR